MDLNMVFAQANEASGDGEAFFGFLIIAGILCGILSACNKKKEYDVDVRGKIKQR